MKIIERIQNTLESVAANVAEDMFLRQLAQGATGTQAGKVAEAAAAIATLTPFVTVSIGVGFLPVPRIVRVGLGFGVVYLQKRTTSGVAMAAGMGVVRACNRVQEVLQNRKKTV